MTTLSLDTLTVFLGWCSVINMIILGLATLSLWLMKDMVTSIHGAMFNLDKADMERAYFQYLAQYKLLVLVFNLIPWIVLKIM